MLHINFGGIYLLEEVIHKIKFNGKIVDDASSITVHFNDYFRSVFSDLYDFERCNTNRSFVHDIKISRVVVLNVPFNIDVRKSAGPDKIPNAFSRSYAEQICLLLTQVFKLL